MVRGLVEVSPGSKGMIVFLGFVVLAIGSLLPMGRPSPDLEKKTTDGNLHHQ
jgi:hypothetical protein